MNNIIKYIELKTGYNHNGPAWISKVRLSKSKKTIYFDAKALKKLSGSYMSNYYDIETHEEYRVSNPKKNWLDRHWAGSGTIFIDEDIFEEYKTFLQTSALGKKYMSVPINHAFDITKFNTMENGNNT